METNTRFLISDLQSLVRQIRTGAYSEASSKLNRCILSIQQQLPIVAGQKPDAIPPILDSIRRMLAHLEHQDWVAFGDIVEFELIPQLAPLSN